jgi:CrcB protein
VIVLTVAIGGGVGAALRWFADTALPRPAGFPVGITVVNVVGSLILGFAVGFGVTDALTPFTVGLLGGFTTFSTWMVDIDRAESVRHSVVVALAPLIIGLLAATVGVLAGAAVGA